MTLSRLASDIDKPQYRCKQCGWIGADDQMLADCASLGEDEIWSSWICPGCGRWCKGLEDYERLSE